ncbi:MAG: dihydroorotate dehydrogenase electron transfer subunit [Eubacterium sp.]|nr:dihydroorotate dehydrogenase electron transfer subunit [Eubacterium sp.]
MQQRILTIIENIKLCEGVYKMKLAGDVSNISAPGQFINIKLNGFFLRRPISVCDLEDGSVTIIYKILGKGTEALSKYEVGTKLDVLTGLGNGYDLSKSGDEPLLVGGGVGIPPLYLLAKKLKAEGKTVKVLLGFNKADEVFYLSEFENVADELFVTTVDGSLGMKGFVNEPIGNIRHSYIYTCGPEAMLKSVYNADCGSGQFSFEERMGCGFGACMGCSCKTLTGSKRICKEGPVMEKEEILW